MSAFRRDDNPVHVNGQLSIALEADTLQEAQEGWSIVARPYRPRRTQDLLDDLGSDSGCCCVLAGNRLLMADGQHVVIERLQPGMQVQTMSGASSIVRIERARLGLTRKAIELRGLADECLIMTDDHPLWVSRPSAGGNGAREGWGTYNLHQVMYEMRQMKGFELPELPTALCFDLPEQVAHRSGWLHVRPIYHHLPPQTEVFHVVVESGCSFIAEGFALFSHTMNEHAPCAPWLGLESDRSAQRFVERLATPA